ncbi:MAG: DUF445 family protein, partial [Firmicutes bacterium]|nr:DUF445 family protein [Bacillota bacterium]
EMMLVRVMLSVRDDMAVRSQLEQAKMQLAQMFPWEQAILWGRDRLIETARDGRLLAAIRQGRHELAHIMLQHPDQEAALEKMVKQAAVAALKRYHPVIGRLVRENLEQMDQQEWIDKLEWYVGRDLQWIRVNGTIVGGLVGLLLAIVLQMIGLF